VLVGIGAAAVGVVVSPLVCPDCRVRLFTFE
jgi:hypothetical protein